MKNIKYFNEFKTNEIFGLTGLITKKDKKIYKSHNHEYKFTKVGYEYQAEKRNIKKLDKKNIWKPCHVPPFKSESEVIKYIEHQIEKDNKHHKITAKNNTPADYRLTQL